MYCEFLFKLGGFNPKKIEGGTWIETHDTCKETIVILSDLHHIEPKSDNMGTKALFRSTIVAGCFVHVCMW